MNSLCASVCRRSASFLAFCFLAYGLKGAQVRVDVGDNFFRPATTNIVVGDSVRWVWIGLNQHSSTHSGTPRLWDSGLRSTGAFTNTFNAVGNFPYFCTVPQHIGQNGTIMVGSGNPPPTVAVQFPTNTTVFAAPATVRVTATASAVNSTITNVQFLRNAVVLGNDTSAPYEAIDSSPPTGSFVYRAIAADARGEKATHNVSVSVVTPVDVRLSNQVRLSPTQFRFSYSGNPGLYYLIEKSSDVSTWQRLGTNRGAPATFTDEGATAGQGVYRVGRLPNP